MTRPFKLVTATIVYATAVVLANYLTAHVGDPAFPGGPRQTDVGFGMVVTTGTFAAGFALFSRDFLHRYAVTTFRRWRALAYVLAVIATAGLVSWLMSTPGLAVASTIAFLGAELVDLVVYVPTRDRWGFVPGIVVSNVVSAPVDTFLFLMIAGFPITTSIVAGQLVAKLAWATLVPLALYVTAVTAYDRRAAQV